MSGGHWDYKNDSLASEIFGYDISVDYDLTSDEHEKNQRKAVRLNPLEDLEISALIYDVFCLLHSYDWAVSGDTDESVYWNDVAEFKKRWFKMNREAQMLNIIDICTETLRASLYKTFSGKSLEAE